MDDRMKAQAKRPSARKRPASKSAGKRKAVAAEGQDTQRPADTAPAAVSEAERGHKRSRRYKLTPEAIDAICAWMGDGKSLRSYCDQPGAPSKSTVMEWLAADEQFRTRLACAREMQADALFDECLDIADDGRNDTFTDRQGNTRTDTDVVQRSKLRIDTRMRIASKLNPKKYGEKLQLDVDDKRPTTPEARTARIAELMALGGVGADIGGV